MAEFEDLSVFLRRHVHASLYKKPSETTCTLEKRVITMNKVRRSNRHEAMFEKRKIPEDMSPVVTPVKIPQKKKKTPGKTVQPKPDEQTKTETNKRYEMLVKWKAEREKKKAAERKLLKPVFKVSSVTTNVGLPNLEMVNKQIKGKPFKSKFAPVNHQFKPPANIQPIYFDIAKTQQKSTSKKVNTTTPRRMVTRSQTKTTSVKSQSSPRSTRVKTAQRKTGKKQSEKTDTRNKTPVKQKSAANPLETVCTSTKRAAKELEKLDHDDKIDSQSATKEEIINNKENTPDQKSGAKPPTYISPFVTVSRGKQKAREEFESRRSGKSFSAKSDHEINSSPKAGAAYFRWLLQNHITRLQGICDEWTKYKTDLNPPEEAVSMIDVAIGQTNLLMSKKFQQFNGLIDKCEHKDTETPVTCEDLHGFWDMIHLQIDNVGKRFENLEKLKSNNWEEILPEVKKVVKKNNKKTKSVKASAGLRAAIQAARKKKLEEPQDDVQKTPKNRNSTRLSVLKSQEKNQTKTSPGLTMMKVAQYAKSVETPGKSILRSDTAKKSAKSHSKSVLFIDEVDTSVDNVENDLNKSNKGKTPRKSGRLTRSKLF